ncbi:MAG: hypothetical protein QXF26_06965 [Candidatus Bathyarchaeia archaeon]
MRKASLVGVILILLLAMAAAPIAALDTDGWFVKEWEPKDIFRHYWTGTRLFPVDGGLQLWELYSEIMMMPAASEMAGDDVEWVRMSITWDPSRQEGEITKFEHHGMNLRFTGWKGRIWINPSYHFEVSGHGLGIYRFEDIWYNLIIEGSFKGDYFPDDPNEPLRGGWTEATERATLRFRFASVGGEILPVNSFTLFSPLAVTVAFAFVVGFTLARRKIYLHKLFFSFLSTF